MQKKFSECEFVDSFFINFDYSGLVPAAAKTIPGSDTFNLPILMRKDIQYIKVKGFTIATAAANAFVGTLVIKCDALASSDKTLCTINLAGGGREAYNTNMDMILKVVTPLAGQLNLYYSAVPAAGDVLTGEFSIAIECYA